MQADSKLILSHEHPFRRFVPAVCKLPASAGMVSTSGSSSAASAQCCTVDGPAQMVMARRQCRRTPAPKAGTGAAAAARWLVALTASCCALAIATVSDSSSCGRVRDNCRDPCARLEGAAASRTHNLRLGGNPRRPASRKAKAPGTIAAAPWASRTAACRCARAALSGALQPRTCTRSAAPGGRCSTRTNRRGSSAART